MCNVGPRANSTAAHAPATIFAMAEASPWIAIVDDDPSVLKALSRLLRTRAFAARTYQSAQEFLAALPCGPPECLIVDLQMPEMSGLDAIIAIRGEHPEARIIVLTTYAGDVQALRALQAGASAYLLKEALERELLETIRAVHAGRKSISPEVSFQLAEHATDDVLTASEVRVLALIAEGKANKEIAKRLSVSEATVKGQVQSILSKLGASDRTHAAMIALKRGIIQRHRWRCGHNLHGEPPFSEAITPL